MQPIEPATGDQDVWNSKYEQLEDDIQRLKVELFIERSERESKEMDIDDLKREISACENLIKKDEEKKTKM